MKVLILYDRIAEAGDRPDQSDVLEQAKAVSRALEDLGHESMQWALSMDVQALIQKLKGRKPDLVFNLVESVEGHGRFIHLVPTLLELLMIPYTGSPSESLYLTSNKLLAKRVMEGAGIRTPKSYLLNGGHPGHTPPKGCYIIKSTWEHASIGLDEDSVLEIDNPQQLFIQMEQSKQKLGGACFAESYIEGREFNISLLASPEGPDVLPPAEIRFHNYPADKWRIVNYSAKWDHASFEYDHTRRSFDFPESDQSLLVKLGMVARACWKLFGLRGYARVDFRVDQDNEPWVLEINANPCLSPDAGFAAAALKSGLDFKEVVGRIIHDRIRFDR